MLGKNSLITNEDLDKVWVLVKSSKFSLAKILLFLIRLNIIDSKKIFEFAKSFVKVIQRNSF